MKLSPQEQAQFEDLRIRRDILEASDQRMLDEINEHRGYLDRPPLPSDTPREDLIRHIAKINVHAPYGNDPWED